jgi:hypothetical protein
MARFVVQFETEDVQSLVKAIKLLQGNGFDPSVHEFADGAKPNQNPEPVVRAPVVATRQPVNAKLDRDEAWKKLHSALKPNPKKVLQLIKEGASNGLSAELIAEQFGEAPNWFTGVLNGGIQRNIKAAGFQLEDVIVIDRSQGTVMYFPGKELSRREVT